MDTGDDVKRRGVTLTMLETFDRSLPVLPLVGLRLERAEALGRVGDDVERLAATDATVAMHLMRIATRYIPAGADDLVSVGYVLSRAGADRIADDLRTSLERGATIHVTPAASRVYLHAVEVALITRALAQRLPEFRVSAGAAYVAGLLHDIGRFIMLAVDEGEFERIEASEISSGDDLRRAERRIAGFDHSELGSLAARRWGFPDSVVAVNEFHHQSPAAIEGIKDPRTRSLVQLVAFADRLAFVLFVHPDIVGSDPRSFALALDEQGATRSLAHFRLSPENVRGLLDGIAARARMIVQPLFESGAKLFRQVS